MTHNNNFQTNLSVLNVLKTMRAKLIEDFLTENHKLYEPMFKYESSPELTNLSIDKYFTIWIEEHWLVMQKLLDENNFDNEVRKSIEEKFAEVIIKYLSTWKSNYNKGNIISMQIISKFKEELQKLLEFGERDQINYQRLNYFQQKHNIIFDRLFKELEKGDI